MKRLGFNWSNYCFSKAMFFVLICLVLCSCSSDDSVASGNEGNYAPETVSKKNFKFYKENQDMWSFEVYFGEEVELITSSSYFFVDDCDAYYEKTGENTAHLFSYYTAYTFISGTKLGVYAEYDLQLTFLSAHHGKYTGKSLDAPLSNNSKTVSGMFVYDTDKGLEHFIENNEEEKDDESDGNEGDKLKIDISSPVVDNVTISSAIIKGMIYTEIDEQYMEIGVCYSKNDNPTINNQCIMSSSKNISTELTNLENNTTYYVRIYVKYKGDVHYSKVVSFKTKEVVNEEENVNEYSLEISRVLYYKENDSHSAYIIRKYIDEDETNGKRIGLCYGTNPNPTITDFTTPIESIRSDVAEVISGLKPGTVYYIRPYLIKDNKPVYYKETSFETIGNNIKLSAEISPDHEIGTAQYAINMDGTFELYVYFDYFLGGGISEHIGYFGKSEGSFEFTIGDSIWEYYNSYRINAKCVETGTIYSFQGKLGDEER